MDIIQASKLRNELTQVGAFRVIETILIGPFNYLIYCQNRSWHDREGGVLEGYLYTSPNNFLRARRTVMGKYKTAANMGPETELEFGREIRTELLKKAGFPVG